jgi:hypothetical protein
MKKNFLISCLFILPLSAGNQTNEITPVIVDHKLPFTISIKHAGFVLPQGIQSYVSAHCGNEFLLLCGRTNGMHSFDGNVPNNNFPPKKQNTTLLVVNPIKKTVKTRSLNDSSSGLTQEQIDWLSVTSPQSYQRGNTLYITGGYGIDSKTNTLSTKAILTAIDVAGLIHWVNHPESYGFASQFIRQISNPVFQVTGGEMKRAGDNETLLMLGQNFTGYYTPSSNGEYTQQIRRFDILDDGRKLSVKVKEATPQNPNYRRRDLNIIPIITIKKDRKVPAFVALSGVFTPDQNEPGIWTVPVEISATGEPSMANPNRSTTFKQGMNNYNSAHVEFFGKNCSTYSVIMGGITFGFFNDGEFLTDSEFPFTNEVTVVERTKKGEYKQYYLGALYPVIKSTTYNPGNTLLFGAGARFLPVEGLPAFPNGVIELNEIKKPTVIGYIVGGIQSTVPNTALPTDSSSSPYVFEVTVTPNCHC